MEPRINAKKWMIILTLLFCLALPSVLYAAAGAMQDYCVVPPFIVGGVLPNLLMLVDNSASMYDLEYQNTAGMFCFDNSYHNSNVCSTTSTTNCSLNSDCPSGETCINQYPGYFDPAKYYIAMPVAGVADGYPGVPYATDITSGNTLFSTFIPVPLLPAGCTYNTSYLCLTLAGTTPDKVAQFVASGKFLNWLTASKMDVQKDILTGGKYVTKVCSTANTSCSADTDCPSGQACITAASPFLQGESRGCVGYRYVKEVPLTDWNPPLASSPITFGVRGDISSDVRMPAAGGTTRIDVFKGDFNNADCQAAVSCYETCGSNCGPCKNSATACLGGTSSSSETTTWNHALSRCWQCPNQKCCPEDITWTGDGNTITNNQECGSLTQAQKQSLQPGDPLYICLQDSSSALTPNSATFNGCVWNNYALDVGLAGGYVGICDFAPGATITSDTYKKCVSYQFANFCRGLKVGEVVDPTAGGTSTSTTGNVPANLVDGGLMGLGNPIRTLHVRVGNWVPAGHCSATTSQACNSGVLDCPPGEQCYPSGVVQQYRNQIRMGAMVFNTYGSRTECTTPNSMITYTCSDATNEDGAHIISYVGDPVGDHSSGLISQIDAVIPATWTPFSEAFYEAIGYFASRSDMQLNATDFDVTKKPVQYRCQPNNVLIITDGQSTADLHPAPTGLVNALHYDTQYDPALNSSITFAGTRNVDDLAWIAQTRKISDPNLLTSPASAAAPVNTKDKITTYVVFSGTSSGGTNEYNPAVLMNDTATRGGGTFQQASNPAQLAQALNNTFQQITAKTASGTASSVLASGEGSGANLIQAIFFPDRKIGSSDIKWTSIMHNLWYYIDPQLSNSTVREDTDTDQKLELTDDKIVNFYFDSVDNQTKIQLYPDANGDGVVDSSPPPTTVTFDGLNSLWEAGKLLFDTAAGNRNIYTNVDTTAALTSSNNAFTTANATALRPLVNVNVNIADDAAHTETQKLINYIRGVDGGTIDNVLNRNRTVTIGGTTGTWKLGDIVNSTPRIVSSIPLNRYDEIYNDVTYKNFTKSTTYKNRGMVFSGANDGMLHAFNLGSITIYDDPNKKASITGANRGTEAWSFIPRNTLPYLKYFADQNYAHIFYVDDTSYLFDASISIDTSAGSNSGTTTCNSATYANYWECDKSVNSWRTILIGGMRLGGGSRGKLATNNGQDCTECVKNPISGTGYSSYFAMDVTDPAIPKLLWEFPSPAQSAPGLNYTTTGPAIIRVGAGTTNGRWLAVFASGPSGYISPTPIAQFMGITEHDWWGELPYRRGNLLLYIVDVKTGTLLRTIDTGKTAAFAGSLLNSTSDLDLNYQDDVVYFGYSQRSALSGTYTAQGGAANSITLSGSDATTARGTFIHLVSTHETKLVTSVNTDSPPVATVDSDWKLAPPANGAGYNVLDGWTQGGVMRLATNESVNPSDWVVSDLITGTRPVTASVTKILDMTNTGIYTPTLRVYFGTGRFFYRIGDVIDDTDYVNTPSRRSNFLYGLVDPCFRDSCDTAHWLPTCCTSTAGAPVLASDTTSAPRSGPGWYIALDRCTDGSGNSVACTSSNVLYREERLVSDPLSNTSGAIFFSTNSPTGDVCSYGGSTHLWAVRYDTGGSLPGAILKGKALIQLSTGSIQEINLADAFGQTDGTASSATHRGGRRTVGFAGLSPLIQGLSLIQPPKPVNMIMHIRKK
ncbi:MAG: pilus assembly protein [Acidobacteriota bacterium]